MTDARTAGAFIDTHAHLDDESFAGDRDGVIERARAAGVDRVINIGYQPARWRSTVALARAYPGISFTLGLHPNHAGDDAEPVWDALRALLRETRPVAIGEIGLDYYRDHASRTTQVRVFERQLDLADEFNLPVVIHQREAEHDLIPFIRNRAGSGAWILHSFDGSQALADEALAGNCYLGVGGLMTRASSAGLREILKRAPIDRLLLETDSPYLVPRGVKSRRNEPCNIPVIARHLAELHERSYDEVVSQTTENARRAFRLNRPESNP